MGEHVVAPRHNLCFCERRRGRRAEGGRQRLQIEAVRLARLARPISHRRGRGGAGTVAKGEHAGKGAQRVLIIYRAPWPHVAGIVTPFPGRAGPAGPAGLDANAAYNTPPISFWSGSAGCAALCGPALLVPVCCVACQWCASALTVRVVACCGAPAAPAGALQASGGLGYVAPAVRA